MKKQSIYSSSCRKSIHSAYPRRNSRTCQSSRSHVITWEWIRVVEQRSDSLIFSSYFATVFVLVDSFHFFCFWCRALDLLRYLTLLSWQLALYKHDSFFIATVNVTLKICLCTVHCINVTAVGVPSPHANATWSHTKKGAKAEFRTMVTEHRQRRGRDWEGCAGRSMVGRLGTWYVRSSSQRARGVANCAIRSVRTHPSQRAPVSRVTLLPLLST